MSALGAPRMVVRAGCGAAGLTPLNQVDAGFAWDEGEGTRSLEFWLRVHRDCFRRSCEQLGVPFHDGLPAVLERFALVWPR